MVSVNEVNAVRDGASSCKRYTEAVEWRIGLVMLAAYEYYRWIGEYSLPFFYRLHEQRGGALEVTSRVKLIMGTIFSG